MCNTASFAILLPHHVKPIIQRLRKSGNRIAHSQGLIDPTSLCGRVTGKKDDVIYLSPAASQSDAFYVYLPHPIILT
jgi:hypothetical protein